MKDKRIGPGKRQKLKKYQIKIKVKQTIDRENSEANEVERLDGCSLTVYVKRCFQYAVSID